MGKYEAGEAVVVSLNVGGQNRSGAGFYRKPPIERPAVFIRYQNNDMSALVRLRTVEGESERIVPLHRVRRP